MKSYTIRKMEGTLHRRLKILAAEKGISIQRAILEALERYVGEEQKIKKIRPPHKSSPEKGGGGKGRKR